MRKFQVSGNSAKCGRIDRNRRGRAYLGILELFNPSHQDRREVAPSFGKSAESCNLIDVRQPGEYESGHLPGARLITMAELANRLGELDRSKPTITY